MAIYLIKGEFCAVNIIIAIAFRAKPKFNGRYIEVAVLQRAGIARVYCISKPRTPMDPWKLSHLNCWRATSVFRETKKQNLKTVHAWGRGCLLIKPSLDPMQAEFSLLNIETGSYNYL